MNEYLSTTPFDLYEMHLFRLVVKYGSFTKAAEVVGLTQSAITRQIQGMENSLGVSLLERTTRRVRPTPAGAYLYGEASRLAGDIDLTLKKLKEEFAGAKKQIRVGVSRSIGLAYLPGFFHASLKRTSDIACQVSQQPSQEILTGLDRNELDVGVLCRPKQLPRTLRATHQFTDAFTLIAPALESTEPILVPFDKKTFRQWKEKQRWLLISEATETGQQLRAWMSKQGWRIEPAMQLDDFDLLINLVELGMGVGFVPMRALALYRQKRKLKQIKLIDRFERELVVVVRKNRKPPQHLQQFIDDILF